MTPRPRSVRPGASRFPLRPIGALLLAVATIGATPIVAHADDNGPDHLTVAEPKLERVSPVDPAVTVEPATDLVTVVLTESYEWDERGPRIEALQHTLGVTADGWYGAVTARAHRTALEFAGLPTDTVPEPVLPPGPSPEAWAALRDCEAGGDYTIISSSGTYRGAYQFNRSTWDSVAGRHDPDLVGVDPADAAPADQDAMALALWHERGSAPWPHCGRHLR